MKKIFWYHIIIYDRFDIGDARVIGKVIFAFENARIRVYVYLANM